MGVKLKLLLHWYLLPSDAVILIISMQIYKKTSIMKGYLHSFLSLILCFYVL